MTRRKNTHFTVYIEQDEDGMFTGSISAVPSCYAEEKTQKEMLKNLQQVLKLCLRNVKNLLPHPPVTAFIPRNNLI